MHVRLHDIVLVLSYLIWYMPSMEKYKSTILNKLSVCNNSLYRDKITYDAHQAL